MNKTIIKKELKFKAVRSSGAGGQNVNKVATKVSIEFNITNSKELTDFEKSLLLKKLENRINKNGSIILFCEETRSQFRNKEIVINKLFELLKNNLKVIKPRKATKPTKSSIIKKAKLKKRRSEKKTLRKKPEL